MSKDLSAPRDPLAALLHERRRDHYHIPGRTPWCEEEADALRDAGVTLDATRPSGDEALLREAADTLDHIGSHYASGLATRLRATRPSGDEALRTALPDMERTHRSHALEITQDGIVCTVDGSILVAALATPSSTPDVEYGSVKWHQREQAAVLDGPVPLNEQELAALALFVSANESIDPDVARLYIARGRAALRDSRS